MGEHKTVSLYPEKEFAEKIKEEAKKENRTMSNYCINILKKYINGELDS